MGDAAVAWLQLKAALHTAPSDTRRHLAAAGVPEQELHFITPQSVRLDCHRRSMLTRRLHNDRTTVQSQLDDYMFSKPT